ncbi:MAG: hypothetical protein P9E67_09905 [Candidatus Competibacter sp.]|nr:hypothetical protein [Candidatus Competibacter sp.]
MAERREADGGWTPWRAGLRVACRQRALVLLTVFAVACERALTLGMHLAGSGPAALGEAALDQGLRWLEQPSRMASLPPFGGMEGYLLVATAAFLLGLFVLVGVVGLLRDLLLRGDYRAEYVLARGWRYCGPMIAFKLPLYLGVGLAYLLVLGAVPLRQPDGGWSWSGLAIGGLLCALMFFGAQIVLSLGAKIIVAEEVRAPGRVYRRIGELAHPHLGGVLRFYVARLLVLAAALAGSALVWRAPLPVGARVVGSIVLLGWATVLLKAATFGFYLRLAGRPAATG